jgi:very-short-patch-repair endonuclease
LCQIQRHLALGAVDAMAHAGHFTVDELTARLARSELRPGLRRARRLAELCEPATESLAESWTRLRIIDAGLPRPRAQVSLGSPGHEEYRIDLGYPDERVGVEFDGLQYHSTAAARRRDEARRDRIRDVYGWRLLVVGRREILSRSSAFELALGELLGQQPKLRRRAW